jgi:hypothetical protein
MLELVVMPDIVVMLDVLVAVDDVPPPPVAPGPLVVAPDVDDEGPLLPEQPKAQTVAAVIAAAPKLRTSPIGLW